MSPTVSGAVPERPRVLSRRRLLAAGALLPLTAACAELPSEGPVQLSGVDVAGSEDLVQNAAGPVVGASPEEILRGFLRACVAGYSDQFATARSFLTREAALTWQPAQDVRVYTGSSAPEIESDGAGAVTVRVTLMHTVDALGVMTLAAIPELVVTYALVEDDGQWRVADLPSGVLLPASSFEAQFRPVALHFLTADRTRLLPETRWIERGRALTCAVRSLLLGPSAWLAGAAATAVPDHLDLAPGYEEVTSVDGRARVVLGARALDLDDGDRSVLASQVRATALGLAEEVTVSARREDGSLVELVPASLPVPGAIPGALVAMSGGSVVRGLSSTRSVLADPQALGTEYARWPALGPQGEVVVVGELGLLRLEASGASATAILSAGTSGTDSLLPPVVDRHGWIWTAVDGVLTAVDAQGVHTQPVASWGKTPRVLGMDLSHEGERIALRLARPGSMTSRVEVRAVHRDDDGRPLTLGAPVVVIRDLDDTAVGPVWADAVSLALLVPPEAPGDGGDGGQEQTWPVLLYVQVGGDRAEQRTMTQARTLAGNRSTGAALVTDVDGSVWQRTGATWRVLATDVSDVGYATA